ncbi:MAG: GyrI-like domain-containing protein [Methanomassiliicoccales archaeon]|jgi:AraC family transcriptional regulator
MSSDIKIIEQEPVPILSIREMVQNTQIKSMMGEMFGQLWMFMEKNKIEVAGPPFAIYHDYDQQKCDMECGFPTTKPEIGEGNIISSSIPGGKCVFAVYTGPYDKIMGKYAEVREYIRKEGLKPKKVMWERYLNDPATVKADQLVTEIYWPVE